MNKQMIKIGISSGDTNSEASKQILQTFSESQIFELFIPILYGYSSMLSYHHKTFKLPYNIHTNNIHRAEEAKKNILNIININNKTIPTTLGKVTAESIMAADKSLYKGLMDLKAKKIDAFVIPTTTSNSSDEIHLILPSEKEGLPILVNNHFRIIEISDLLSIDMFIKKIKVLHSILVHDFMITLPRIAVLSINPPTEIITSSIQTISQTGILCFGTFDAKDFFNSDIYRKFDAALIVGQKPIDFISQYINIETNATFIGNLPYVITIADANTTLNYAIYLAIDLYRNRQTDQEICSNPLKFSTLHQEKNKV